MKNINKLFKSIAFCTIIGATVANCDLEVEPLDIGKGCLDESECNLLQYYSGYRGL